MVTAEGGVPLFLLLLLKDLPRVESKIHELF